MPLRAEEIVLARATPICRSSIAQQGDGAVDSEPREGACLGRRHARRGRRHYGKYAVGVMLSGMGRDGLSGAGRLVERGGAMLVQNRQSSAVWGMPRAVAEAGLASAILPPIDLARRIGAHAAGDESWT